MAQSLPVSQSPRRALVASPVAGEFSLDSAESAIEDTARRYKRDAIICVSLHVVLVVVHVVLFGVYSHHYERGLTFNISSFTSNWLPFIVTTILQVIGTIYLAILVLVTQRLALRGDLRTRQTLTAIHDKSTAWLGLGSAFNSLWQQTKLRTAAGAVTCITVYLLSVFTLHITVPSLFHISPYNATVATTQTTTLARLPDIDLAKETRLPAYDILLFYGQVPTLGLVDNMVYDVIPEIPAAFGNVTVNASSFDVDCLALPQAVQIQPDPPLSNLTAENIVYQTNDEGSSLAMRLPYNMSVYTASPETAPGYPLYMVSVVPVVDSSGQLAPKAWKPLFPQVIQTSIHNFHDAVLYTGVQLMACEVHINQILINVSAETREPLVMPSAQLQPKLWANWSDYNNTSVDGVLQVPGLAPPSNHVGGGVPVATVQGVNLTATATAPLIPDLSPSNTNTTVAVPQLNGESRNVSLMPFVNNGTYQTVVPTSFDTFIMEDLGVVTANRTNITLAELNLSIGRALAAMYWYAGTLNYSDTRVQNAIAEFPLSYLPEVPRLQGAAIMTLNVQRSRLNMPVTPLIIGLVASVILVLTSVILVYPREARHDASLDPHVAVDSAGVLQFTWLLGNVPPLAQVEVPRLQALRAAGMFDVQVVKRKPTINEDVSSEKVGGGVAPEEVAELTDSEEGRAGVRQ